MTDTRTPEQRKRIMANVQRRDTAPEIALRQALYDAGVRGWRCDYRKAPGRPDLAWPGLRVAVFVDGAFWHGHPSRHRPGRSGPYWDEKIESNIMRDRRVDAELRASGWLILRIWDFEVRRSLAEAVCRVCELLLESSRLRTRSMPAWLESLRRDAVPSTSPRAASPTSIVLASSHSG